MALDYTLSFAGVPFVSDVARVVRTHLESPEHVADEQVAPKKHQPLTDLQDEINRIIPFHYLRDFSPPSRHAGKNLSAIARNIPTYPQPDTEVKIGDWYYPNGASRWSVFRGLATSSQVKEMLAQTGGSSPSTFVMRMNPLAPNHPDSAYGPYTLISSMYMLPPRPLAEHGGEFDGLYLVTLVDERYYFRYFPVCLHPTPNDTWTSLLITLSSILNISFAIPSISSVYGTPEPDSQLWSNFESAGALLDAVSLNIGRIVVRNLDGSYSLLSSLDSQAIVAANRGNADTVVRAAGGDIFYQGTLLPDLTPAKNSVVPSTIFVNFPKYIIGNDPVPHYLNSRFANQRPTSWYEDSFGEVHSINVPIQSGGSLVSGLLGTGVLSLHSTAKALYSTEASAASGMLPLNSSALTSLAMQLSQNLYNSRVAFALDEVYPGTYAWQPEGLHDIIWTFSQKRRQATTRVMRIEWNRQTDEFQHSHVPLAETTNIPPGEGGQSVAQTWRDGSSFNAGEITVEIANTMGASDTTVSLNSSDCLPTQNRWKGQIDSEVILFEGTSGGTSVNIAYRGIDGTVASPHTNNTVITLLTPNQTYGVNLVTSEKMQFVYPSDWTSGGIQGVNIVPQTQTIQVFSSGSEVLNGVSYFSGQVQSYDTTGNLGRFLGEELVWAVERNEAGAVSGSLYGGQFAGFSKTIQGVTRPVYLFSAVNSFNSGTVNYNNTTINYGSGTVINYTSGTTTVNYYGSGSTTNIRNDYITNIFSNTVWNIIGSGYLNIVSALEICGYQFWCCYAYSFNIGFAHDWVLPYPATVFDLEAPPGGTTITGIVPPQLGVSSGPAVIVLRAVSYPIIITNQDGRSAQNNQIHLSSAYSSAGSVTLSPEDSIILWWDACTVPFGWKVLACTVGGGGVQGEHNTAGLVGPRSIVNFIDGGGASWSVVDDPGNSSIDVSLTSTGSSPTSANNAVTASNVSLGLIGSTDILDIVLPSAGTYIIWAQLSIQVSTPASPAVLAQVLLGDTTNAPNMQQEATAYLSFPSSITNYSVSTGMVARAITTGTNENIRLSSNWAGGNAPLASPSPAVLAAILAYIRVA